MKGGGLIKPICRRIEDLIRGIQHMIPQAMEGWSPQVSGDSGEQAHNRQTCPLPTLLSLSLADLRAGGG